MWIWSPTHQNQRMRPFLGKMRSPGLGVAALQLLWSLMDSLATASALCSCGE